jgi:hypothetical protein
VPNNLLEIGGFARDTYWDGHACLGVTHSSQASAEHFQQCAKFPLLRNRSLGPLAVTVLPINALGVIGPPRSEQNTNGDASCSRCRRRSAHALAGDGTRFRGRGVKLFIAHAFKDLRMLNLHLARHQQRTNLHVRRGLCFPHLLDGLTSMQAEVIRQRADEVGVERSTRPFQRRADCLVCYSAHSTHRGLAMSIAGLTSTEQTTAIKAVFAANDVRALVANHLGRQRPSCYR